MCLGQAEGYRTHRVPELIARNVLPPAWARWRESTHQALQHTVRHAGHTRFDGFDGAVPALLPGALVEGKAASIDVVQVAPLRGRRRPRYSVRRICPHALVDRAELGDERTRILYEAPRPVHRLIRGQDVVQRAMLMLRIEARAIVVRLRSTCAARPLQLEHVHVTQLERVLHYPPKVNPRELNFVDAIRVIVDSRVVGRQHGLNIVGADLVEVSPPYDQAGTTALVGANLLYEMLCVLPGVQRKP